MNGRRTSIRPSRNTAESPSHTGHEVRSFPPNAPGLPRAIFQATCGPVHASVTAPRSVTLPVAISPARPEYTCTDHNRVLRSKVASVGGSGG